MAGQFSSCVEYGLGLSKRILYGKESVPTPSAMSRSSSRSRPAPEQGYLPEAPMVYAAVSDPAIVDNPDIPSYQPYVYGLCEPPALIPLHMHGVALEVESYLDTAFVTVTGNWRVHCISTGKKCDCRVAVPMGEKVVILFINCKIGTVLLHYCEF